MKGFCILAVTKVIPDKHIICGIPENEEDTFPFVYPDSIEDYISKLEPGDLCHFQFAILKKGYLSIIPDTFRGYTKHD